MLKVIHNRIYLTRGDTAYIEVDLTDENGNAIELEDDDQLIFTVKYSTSKKNALLTKTVNEGLVTLSPDDTSDLDFGCYVYDIQLTRSNGDVFTIVEPTLFKITEEVTYA